MSERQKAVEKWPYDYLIERVMPADVFAKKLEIPVQIKNSRAVDRRNFEVSCKLRSFSGKRRQVPLDPHVAALDLRTSFAARLSKIAANAAARGGVEWRSSFLRST